MRSNCSRESVAIVGANGAVGMCMVQAAAALGADVVAVVRHGDASPRLRDLGASRVVVAEAADAVEASAHAHELIEAGRIARTPAGTVGRIVLCPSP